MRRKKLKPSKKAKKILGIFIVGMGLVLTLYFGIPGVQKGRETLDWIRVDGKILSSKVKKHKSRSSSRRRGRLRTHYNAEIEYSYLYNGKEYLSRNVMWKSASSSRRVDADITVSKYSVGSFQSVFINPASPDEAVLEKGVSIASKITLGIGFVFIILGGFLLLPTGIRRKKS